MTVSLAALFANPATWAALVMLAAMEVVLGIDNLAFVSILSNKLAEADRHRMRRMAFSALMKRLKHRRAVRACGALSRRGSTRKAGA